MRRFLLGLALSLVAAVLWILPGCSSDPSSSILCQPSQLVRCNSCPQTGKCAGAACRGWLQCSSDGTSFVGTCSECAVADPSADSCASLETCCAMSLSSADQSECSSVVMNNDEDDCYALLNQFLSSKSCGGVSNPPPAPESDSGGTVSGACSKLAPCCDAAGHTVQEEGACSQLVSNGNETACADSLHFYCAHPTVDAGCPSGNAKCRDAMTPEAEASVGDENVDEAETGDGDIADSSDGCPDGFVCSDL